ncbi:interleukin-15 receptor subunit alpha-like isoform X3 [Micropterus dolomieu]|uniref:interleukin-15 receptor subunit alpha-like isoform X3 n=1 Tax=Micropterus dolomieu TaxID=147949 RepID=UPI001E8D9EAC|nr:interleukin-15 receptor subunit alpha-like isoform X3 [Micropterus dolomieu]
MDLSPCLLSFCVMVTCLIGAARCSNPDKSNCCPEIDPFPLTEPPPGTSCFQLDNFFRYTCIKGYLRKVGTSSLIKCKQENSVLHWTKPTLQCIPDPTITTTTPPKTKTTESTTDIPTTTATAASTSLQMTPSVSTSASVTAETHSTEPTSSGLQDTSNHSQGETRTTATDWTTSASTTTQPSNSGTNCSRSENDPNSMTTVGITCASLVVVCALIGIIFLCYKRRSKHKIPLHTAEEQVPMNHVPSAPGL